MIPNLRSLKSQPNNAPASLSYTKLSRETVDCQEDWKLVLKVGKTAKLGFSSPLWTNMELLNEASATDTEEDAKYSAFNTEPFERIRMCVGSPETNCVVHHFMKKYDSAKALFSAGYIRDEYLDKGGILSAFGPAEGKYKDCPMQRPGNSMCNSSRCVVARSSCAVVVDASVRPGFNIECKDGNKARWGFCNNCQSQPCQNEDSDDADAAIGIGLAGQRTSTEVGAGWTARRIRNGVRSDVLSMC